MTVYDSGDTAWVFVCTVLVMLAVTGAALIHAGMVRRKSALHAIMLVAGAVGAVTVAWVLVGFSLAYGPDSGGGFIGGLTHAGLVDIAGNDEFSRLSIPPVALAMFHMTVAILAGAIVAGVAVERAKFGATLVFFLAWSVLVYPTVAHWVLGSGGWLREWGVLDFGSGTLVGVTAGASALALAIVLGPRREAALSGRPHSLPLALLGGGLVWAGWVGLTAGSSLQAGGEAASAALATHVAAVGGLAGWTLLEKRIGGVVTASGALWGAVSGLAAITPAAGFLDPFASLLLGFSAGVIAVLLVRGVRRHRIDDPLGAFRVHGVSAAIGMVFVGLFGRLIVGAETEPVGAMFGGGAGLVGKQIVAVLAVAAFAFVGTIVIAFVVRAVMGLRVTPEAEDGGIDQHQHGENAYGEPD